MYGKHGTGTEQRSRCKLLSFAHSRFWEVKHTLGCETNALEMDL